MRIFTKETLRESYRKGFHVVDLHDGHGHKIIVPGIEKGVDSHRYKPRKRQRQQDLQHRTYAPCTVNARRFVQRTREGVKEGFHQRNGQRKCKGGIRQDDAQVGVKQVPLHIKSIE